MSIKVGDRVICINDIAEYEGVRRKLSTLSKGEVVTVLRIFVHEKSNKTCVNLKEKKHGIPYELRRFRKHVGQLEFDF